MKSLGTILLGVVVLITLPIWFPFAAAYVFGLFAKEIIDFIRESLGAE